MSRIMTATSPASSPAVLAGRRPDTPKPAWAREYTGAPATQLAVADATEAATAAREPQSIPQAALVPEDELAWATAASAAAAAATPLAARRLGASVCARSSSSFRHSSSEASSRRSSSRSLVGGGGGGSELGAQAVAVGAQAVAVRGSWWATVARC